MGTHARQGSADGLGFHCRQTTENSRHCAEELAEGPALYSRLVCVRDAVKCGYSKALHLVLFIYAFKPHTQN